MMQATNAMKRCFRKIGLSVHGKPHSTSVKTLENDVEYSRLACEYTPIDFFSCIDDASEGSDSSDDQFEGAFYGSSARNSKEIETRSARALPPWTYKPFLIVI